MAATPQAAKPAYIEMPSYRDFALNSRELQHVRESRSLRSMLSKNVAPVEDVHSSASSLSSTCISTCMPSPSAAGNPRAIAAATEESVSNALALHNTYFFDHRCGVGFISIPHLGNHACTTALGIFRAIENWLEEKLFRYSRLGHVNEDFVPILEENVKSTAAGVASKLEAAPRIFSGLSHVTVHIRTGHVYTLEGGRDLVAEEDADDFFQQYPLFLDVSVCIRRCSASLCSSTTSPVSDRFAQRANSRADASLMGTASLSSSVCQEFSCLEVIAESPSSEQGLPQPYARNSVVSERNSTCLAVKVTSDIKRFEFAQPSELPETTEPKLPRYCGSSPGGRFGDISPAFILPSCDEDSGLSPPLAESVVTRAQSSPRQCGSLQVGSDLATLACQSDVAAEFSADDEVEVFEPTSTGANFPPKLENGDDDLIFKIDPEASTTTTCLRGLDISDAPQAALSAEAEGWGSGGGAAAEFQQRRSEDVASLAAREVSEECTLQSLHHEHEGRSAYLDGSTVRSSRRTSAADVFDVESEMFIDLDDYYTATVVKRVAW